MSDFPGAVVMNPSAIESEGMEKDIPCKWKSKEGWSSNSHIRKNRL